MSNNAEERMKHIDIKYLYHYKGFQGTKSLLKNLKDHKFWATTPASFNDPYDCSGGFGFKNMSQKGFEHLLGSAIGKKENIDLQREIKNVGVICFSERKDNILMWSHYAEKHKGCCLQFKREENNCLGSKCCVPVHYSDIISKVPFADYHRADENERLSMLAEIYSVKAADWFYEREWRYFVREGNKFNEFDAKVEAIIFGALVNAETINSFLGDMPIQIDKRYKAELKDKYQIELKEIPRGF